MEEEWYLRNGILGRGTGVLAHECRSCCFIDCTAAGVHTREKRPWNIVLRLTLKISKTIASSPIQEGCLQLVIPPQSFSSRWPDTKTSAHGIAVATKPRILQSH